MKPTSIALGLVLAAGATIAAPAAAQYGQAAPPPPRSAAAPAEQKPATETKIKPSKGAIKAIMDLQTAVKAKDAANIPAKVAAAQAVAKTPDDRYAIAVLQLEAARGAKDNAAIAAAIDAVLGSGKVEQHQLRGLYAEQANAFTAAKQPDRAAAALQHLIALDPSDAEAQIVYANTLHAQGKNAEAVAMLQKNIAARTAAGQKADETVYKLAVQYAYDAKLPSAIQITRDWVAAYPSPKNWANAFAVYQNLSTSDDASILDVLRLKRAAGALSTESDFHKYAYLAAAQGYPGEAKAVLEEGFAAGKIDRNKPLFKDILAEVSPKAASDKAAVAGAAAAGLSASTARKALSNGDLLAGAGQYAKAAEVYRAALGKTGADANLINLHLGAALAQQGDKAGATAALNAVTGANADLAKLWLTYLATRA
jgi:lipopolysaccharide biosynthesis regulator YciM